MIFMLLVSYMNLVYSLMNNVILGNTKDTHVCVRRGVAKMTFINMTKMCALNLTLIGKDDLPTGKLLFLITLPNKAKQKEVYFLFIKMVLEGDTILLELKQGGELC